MADNKTQIIITARDETRAAINSATSGLKGVGSAASSLHGILATLGVGLSAGAFIRGVKSIIDGADHLAKASQKYGVAVEQLSALSYAGKLADVSLEAIGNGLKKLSVNMSDTAAGTGEAKEAFKALGLSVLDSSGALKSSDQMLSEIADKFAGMEDGAGKTAIAVTLLGRAGADLIPLLNAGSRGLAQMKDEAAALGVIVGGDLARKSEEFNDNLTRLGATIDALKIRIAGGIIGPLGDLVDKFAKAAVKGDLFAQTLRSIGQAAFALQGALARILLPKPLAYLVDAYAGAGFAALEPGDGSRLAVGRIGGDPAVGPKEKAPLLPSSTGATNKRGDDIRKAFEDATQAIHDNALAAAEADQEIQKLTDHYTDMIEPAAATMRDLNKFNDLAPALGFTAEQVERVRDAFREKIDIEQFGTPLKDLSEKADEAMGEMTEFAMQAARNMQDAFADFLFDAMDGKFENMAQNFKRTIDKMVADLIAAQLLKYLVGDFGKTGSLGGVAGEFFKVLFGGGKADGGPVYPGQYYVVGERGPEILMPRTAGTVVPNGMGGGHTINMPITFVVQGQMEHRNQQQISARVGGAVNHALRKLS